MKKKINFFIPKYPADLTAEIKMADTNIRGKNKEELLNSLNAAASPNSPMYGRISLAILVRCTEDLEKAILGLKRKINFLDVMLIVASFIGAIATGLMAYKIFFP